MGIKNILIVYTTPRTDEQKSSLSSVKEALKKIGISYSIANRDRLSEGQFAGREFVIAVGGDGTFLRAAQFAKEHKLFGVNSDVLHKEGFFMKSNKDNFEDKLKKIINRRYEIKKLPRLEARINGKKIDSVALNEFFVGAKKPYQSSKYIIKIGGRKERQKSSGVLVATPAGSHSWAKSSCGKTLPLGSSMCQLVVREPYEGRVFGNYKSKYKLLKNGQKVDIFSEMLGGVLIADSVGKEHCLKDGDWVAIKMSNKPLNWVLV